MNVKNKFFVSLFVICIAGSFAYGQKVGSTSMQFLKVMPCARATALGDAYSVLAQGSEAVFWNPSGVALAGNHEFTTTYVNWIFDAKQYALGYATPLANIGALGVQLQYVDFGAFEEAVVNRPYIKNETDPGLTGRQFRPYAYLAGITYARNLTERFSLGVSFKFAHESLFDENTITAGGLTMNTYGNAFLFDFGIRYNTGYRTLQIAAAVQNFGPDFKYALEKDHVPLQFRVGMACDLIGPNSLLLESGTNRVGIAFDIFQPNDYEQQLHTGVEYEFNNIFSLRAGYKYNYDTEGLTFGAGFKQAIAGTLLKLDYSYGSLGTYLGSAHRISLGVDLQ